MQGPIRIERTVEKSRLLVVGLTEENEVVYNVSLRRWATTDGWIGRDIGPVVEIDWLEVKPGFRSPRVLFRALCEALNSAIFLAGDTVTFFGMSTENDRLERALERRDEFDRIDELPLPFVTTSPRIQHLKKLVCR